MAWASAAWGERKMAAAVEEEAVKEEAASFIGPNLVLVPVPYRQPRRRPPLQATLASPQQQLDDGLLESSASHAYH
uniref:Uncharacterized protein n=1 Tax=Oryza barthii TaxID=65489 RepID=A0A0D3H633_9ORYZ